MGSGSKKTLLASEQNRLDVARQRDEWITLRQPRMCLEPHRLVFIDETGTTTKMTRLRGRAPRGERLRMHVPFGHWHTQTFVAGLRCDGLTAPWVLDGPMNRCAFELYVETQLAPTLGKGDVVIMDNLSSHKGPRVAAVFQDRGDGPLFLPPFSPDHNPFELAFAKQNELLRKKHARTIEALWQAIGDICALFTPTECWNFFRQDGYVRDLI
jgi:transposase